MSQTQEEVDEWKVWIFLIGAICFVLCFLIVAFAVNDYMVKKKAFETGLEEGTVQGAGGVYWVDKKTKLPK